MLIPTVFDDYTYLCEPCWNMCGARLITGTSVIQLIFRWLENDHWSEFKFLWFLNQCFRFQNPECVDSKEVMSKTASKGILLTTIGLEDFPLVKPIYRSQDISDVSLSNLISAITNNYKLASLEAFKKTVCYRLSQSFYKFICDFILRHQKQQMLKSNWIIPFVRRHGEMRRS